MTAYVQPSVRGLLLAALVLVGGCAPTIPAVYQQAIDRQFQELAQRQGLEAQLERQMQLGEFELAEQTLEVLEAQQSELVQRCAQTWRINDEIDRLSEAEEYEQVEVLMRSRPFIMGCESRPDGQDYADEREELQRRRQLAQTDTPFLPRESLFVSPITLVCSEPDARPVVMSVEERTLLVEAHALLAMNRLDEAEPVLQQALLLAGRGEASQIYFGLSLLAERRGDRASAIGYLRSGLARIEPQSSPHAMRAPLSSRLALLLLRGGDEAAAVATANSNLDAHRTSVGAARYACELHNFGVFQHWRGRLDAAHAAYRESLGVLHAQRTDPFSTENVIARAYLPSMLSNLGLLQWRQGQLAAALQSFMTAKAALGDDQPLAFDRSEASELAEADILGVEVEAMLTLELAQAEPRSDAALALLLQRKGAVLQRRSQMMAGLRSTAGAQPAPRRAGSPFEQLEQMRQQGGQARSGSDAELLEAYEAALAERSALVSSAAETPEEQGQTQQRIKQLDIRIRAMEQSIGNAAALREGQGRVGEGWRPDVEALAEALEDGRIDEVMDAEMARARAAMETQQQTEQLAQQRWSLDIQSRLPPDAVLLEMVRFRPLSPDPSLPESQRWGPARYGSYLISGQGPVQFVDFGAAADLEPLIHAFREALASPEDDTAREIGRQLDARLFEPVRQRVATARWFVVAPAGLLNLLPVAALVDAQGDYLVQNYLISWVTSGRELLFDAPVGTASSAPLIVANPSYERDESPLAGQPQAMRNAGSAQRSRDFVGIRFSPLPATVREARALQGIWPDARTISGVDATETALKQAQAPRLLHIATHGFFLEDLPRSTPGGGSSENPLLRSGLAFAGANEASSGVDDGVLTALEAAALDLSGTQLVVLSACDTGVGEVRNGEGVFGLRRAFAVAGAQSLLMTLWSVDDQVTADAMIDYHQRLAQGEGRVEALQQVQLALLQQEATQHPYYWASFMLAGRWERL